MLCKSSFGLLALKLLLQALYTRGEPDNVQFDTEFRLMIMVYRDPSDVQLTIQNQDGGESVSMFSDADNTNFLWYYNINGQGGYRVGYMGWSRPTSEGRDVWIHKPGTDKDSGTKCTVTLNHDPQVPYLAWDLDRGLDFRSTMNGFENQDGLVVTCLKPT